MQASVYLLKLPWWSQCAPKVQSHHLSGGFNTASTLELPGEILQNSDVLIPPSETLILLVWNQHHLKTPQGILLSSQG